MERYGQLIEGQRRVYASCLNHTLEVNKDVLRPIAGYVIVLRHSKSVGEPVARVSRKVNRCLASTLYDNENVHTTIMRIKQSWEYRQFRPDGCFLSLLNESVRKIAPPVKAAIEITFGRWLLMPDSVIAAGDGNEAFWETAGRIRKAAAVRGVDAVMPWGAHSTVARFKKPGSTAMVRRLSDLLDRQDRIGKVRCQRIEACWFQSDQDGFRLFTEV